MQDQTQWENAYTPVTLLQLFANAFRLNATQALLLLKGVYQDRQRGSYQGYYYNRIKDEQSGQIVTVCVPEAIKEKLLHGRTYVLKGALQKDVRLDGVVEPVFLVAERLAELDVPIHVHSSEAIVQQKQAQGFKIVNNLLMSKLRAGQTPRLALVFGMTSTVRDDVIAALGLAYDRYILHEKRINIVSESEICDTLNEINRGEYDAVVIVRGSGPGQEVFDSMSIARIVLDLRPALLTAIGHVQEATLLERIADKRFTTPTALGVYLAQLVEVSGRQEDSTITQTQMAHYQRQLLWMRIALAVMAVVIIVLLATR
ncbi:MAG: hypothetical protein JXA21_25600 [Anaerolineae bacterium]|nr:hypothetical protein [Anaerolineae bacterium]